MSIWVASAELLPATSRHLPDCGLRMVPSAWATQVWAPVPLHVHNCALVPSTRAPPATSRHLPSALMVLPGVTVHCCAAEALQVYSCTLVPSAVPALLTSRHLPARPRIA